MNIEYKQAMVNGLYGLIEGNAKSLKEEMLYWFKSRFQFVPDLLEVLSTDKLTTSERPVWIGTMTINLTINGETFSVSRDWEEELKIDKAHPNYDDNWFYDSTDQHSYKKCRMILNSLT